MKKNIKKLIAAGMIAALLSGQTAFAAEVENGAEVPGQTAQVTGEEIPSDEVTGEEVPETPGAIPEDELQGTQPSEPEGETTEEQTPADPSTEIQTESLPEETEDESGEEQHTYTLQYRVHVQTYGWQDWVDSGEIAGTTGEAKRLEAIEMRIVDEEGNPSEDLHVEYRAHVQTYGWQDWTGDGQTSGTTGQAKRLEAVQIRLTGDESDSYVLDYKTHVQTLGWLGFAQDEELAGTQEFAKRMEAVQIYMNPVSSGHQPEDGRSFLREYTDDELSFSGHVQTYGDMAGVSNGDVLGTTGEAKRMEGITVHLDTTSAEVAQGNIQYAAHVQTYGWSDYVNNETFNGTTGQSKRLEAVKIQLTGEIAEYYDVYYRVHAQTYGWMAWTLNGQPAGTEGYAKRLEAIQIKLVLKGNVAPSTAGEAFYNRNNLSGVVAQIKQYASSPYRPGGATPLGWDCSGCVQWIYKNIFNISIPRTSYAQALLGKSISIYDKSQWKVGDILCYQSGGVINHVGIYLGNNEMIHALNSKYGTQIHDVDWYEKWDSGNRLADVRRVF